MKTVAFLTLASIAVSACGNETADADVPVVVRAKSYLSQQARDPDSVKFRNLAAVPGGNVCGEVNAANGFGGMSGFKRFIYYELSTGPGVQLEADGAVDFPAAWRAICDGNADQLIELLKDSSR